MQVTAAVSGAAMTQTATSNQGAFASDVLGRNVSGFNASQGSDAVARPATEYGCVDWYPYADDEQTEFFSDQAGPQ
jgi:hypothetical protein